MRLQTFTNLGEEVAQLVGRGLEVQIPDKELVEALVLFHAVMDTDVQYQTMNAQVWNQHLNLDLTTKQLQTKRTHTIRRAGPVT